MPGAFIGSFTAFGLSVSDACAYILSIKIANFIYIIVIIPTSIWQKSQHRPSVTLHHRIITDQQRIAF